MVESAHGPEVANIDVWRLVITWSRLDRDEPEPVRAGHGYTQVRSKPMPGDWALSDWNPEFAGSWCIFGQRICALTGATRRQTRTRAAAGKMARRMIRTTAPAKALLPINERRLFKDIAPFNLLLEAA